MSATTGAVDRKNITETVYVSTTVTGCLLQPVNVVEDVSNIDYALTTYMFTSEPFPAALAMKADDMIKDPNTGDLYRVIGTKIFPGPNGLAHHVVIYANIPSGLNV